MAELTVTIDSNNNYAVEVKDTVYKVGLAEYGGYGPRGPAGNDGATGPQGPVGPSGSADPTQIPVNIGGTSTDLQTAITQLSQLFFQQSSEPVVGVSSGDLWYDTTLNVLKVYQDAAWVAVIAQPNLEVAVINGGYF